MLYKKSPPNGSPLNVKPKPMKLLEDNIGESPCDLGLGSDFLGHQKPGPKEKNRNLRHQISLKLVTFALPGALLRE